MSSRLYSIGYATKPIPTFIEQLNRYHINVVADIRSVPFSKTFHDYHQGAIQGHLVRAGIRYVYLGEELGPRSKEPHHYDACGQVQFDRLRHSSLYKQGVERLKTGIQRDYTIALMCAEKDPANCHRSLLIGYDLQRTLGMTLWHITHNGELEDQTALEQRLSHMHQLDEDLFLSAEEAQEKAYQQQLKKTSYRRPAD